MSNAYPARLLRQKSAAQTVSTTSNCRRQDCRKNFFNRTGFSSDRTLCKSGFGRNSGTADRGTVNSSSSREIGLKQTQTISIHIKELQAKCQWKLRVREFEGWEAAECEPPPGAHFNLYLSCGIRVYTRTAIKWRQFIGRNQEGSPSNGAPSRGGLHVALSRRESADRHAVPRLRRHG